MRLILDMSSVLWNGLLAGKDGEGYDVQHNGRKVTVNTAAYGYENVVNSINAALADFGLSPINMVMVFEGRDSKKRRCMIEPTYKANREGEKDSRPKEAYEEFNKLKELIRKTYKNLGAIAVSQPYVEGDDVIAYIVQNLDEDCVVMSNDNDLIVLNGKNAYGSTCQVRISGEVGINKYGAFDFKLVTLYKSLVGDSSDNIKGVKGFGPAAWMALNVAYDDDGCFELMGLIEAGSRDEIAQIAADNKCKLLAKIVDNWDGARVSLKLAQLHPEWVDTMNNPLEWDAGMVRHLTDDERLRKWRAAQRLVTADNYEAALAFLKSKTEESPFFSMDFETTTPDESDDWLEQRGKAGVDVIGSTIVSMGLTFGANQQYGYYISVDHADTNNCTLEQLAMLLEAIPQDKFMVAHNAAGFELPVAYNSLGERWKNNGWRGFIPNMVDTRIAASFWDENQPSHGLKQLTKLLLNYEQATYAETTTKTGEVGTLSGGQVVKRWDEEGVAYESRQYKMHQLVASEVVDYGTDDVFTASALWNFFHLFMQLDRTYDAFIRLEQKPMYLSALAYVQGLDVDVSRMKMLEKQDEEAYTKYWSEVEAFLIEKGWEGVSCPVFEELTPANIKQAVKIVLGEELVTMVRTQSKLATMVSELDDGETLGAMIADNRVDLVNELIARYYIGKPDFNVGSPKQISHLLYDVIGMPMRLRNKATEAMKAKGIREGNPRTDDDAINMAIKLGDVPEKEAGVLKSLLEMKSCNTRKSLYWSAYPGMIHWKTGKLHPELRQSSTNTRRWTGAMPNIQQMDSNPDGVRSVVSGNGRVVASLDQSSQEVRLMAELSQDEGLLSCYVGENLKDTHSLVAHRIAGVTYEEFMAMRVSEDKAVAKKADSIRKISKSVFFGYLFGAAAPKIAETLGISENEAQDYIDAIERAFPKIKEYQEESKRLAEDSGYVPITGGSRRHLAKLINSDDRWEASKAARQAGNARIQGAAANQIKTVMSDIWDSDLLETTSFEWLFCVHDEVVITADRQDAAEVFGRVHEIMTKKFLSSLPSESSIGVGRNFGQLTELEKPLAALGVGFDAATVQVAVDALFS